jgi:RHS repeat-associated protein
MPLYHIVISLEPYQQTYAYDTGNNLTLLSHQANSGNWQQTLAIHPNNNRGTQTQQSTNDFDTNGNLLNLNNIGSLKWCYNNSLNQFTKADKPNTTQYYIYDYQGRRVRTVTESNHQVQNQRNYLLSLDISTNQAKQQSRTLHIGTHILSESSKDNTQTRYQLANHLQSNTLELDDKAQTLSYEHYYPYGGTAIIAGKDKIQVQQKRYRYTGKERDDSSGLSYYGARYLAPWLARWISPDAAGSVAGSNLYVYAGNNPLKYIDPTGHFPLIPWNRFVQSVNAYKENQRDLNIWVGESHDIPQGNYLAINLNTEIKFKNFIIESIDAKVGSRPEKNPAIIRIRYGFNGIHEAMQKAYPDLSPEKIKALIDSRKDVMMMAATLNSNFIGRDYWRDKAEYERMRRRGSFKGSSLFLVGAAHTLTNIKQAEDENPKAYPAFKYMGENPSIAVTLKSVIDENIEYFDTHRDSIVPDFGVWVEGKQGSQEGIFLAHGPENIMRETFGNIIEELPMKLSDLSEPVAVPPIPQVKYCVIL